MILLCRLGFGEAAFGDWGWRVPFLISAVLVVLSIYIRLKLEESPLFARLRSRASPREPGARKLQQRQELGPDFFALFGATAPEGVVWYTGQFYALFYMTTV